jgi:hypothetical protein
MTEIGGLKRALHANLIDVLFATCLWVNVKLLPPPSIDPILLPLSYLDIPDEAPLLLKSFIVCLLINLILQFLVDPVHEVLSFLLEGAELALVSIYGPSE